MKQNHKKLFIIITFMIITCLFNIFVAEIFNETNLPFIIFLLISFGLTYFLVGMEKSRNIYALDVMQIVFIFCIVYMVASYIFGFFFGFIKSPYSLKLLKLLQNTVPVIVVILLQELIRFQIVAKGKDNKLIVFLITILFIALDISLSLQWFVFTDSFSIYEFIGTICLKSICRNCLLSYISLKVGYKAPIMYRFIFELSILVLPIYPDLGLYLECLLAIIFPVTLFLKLNTFFATFKKVPRNVRVTKLKRFLLLTPTYAIIIVVFILISGIFKFYAMAIVSNSMAPTIYRGDMVIVEKLDMQEIELLEVGTTIAFQMEGRVVVHRIIEINNTGRTIAFSTQGDNNDDPDNWTVTPEIIKGKVGLKMPMIGYPSVLLYELLK